MATWRDRLRPASFRGVAFFVEVADSLSGRRLARHDFTQFDFPVMEDLGKQPSEFRLEAYLLGPDYMTQRDALIAALEQPGPSVLVHPYLGSKLVQQTQAFQFRETTADGGFVRFAIFLVEIGQVTAAPPPEDRDQALEDAADALSDATSEDIASTVVADRVQVSSPPTEPGTSVPAPEFVREATRDELLHAGQVLQGLNVFSRRAQEVAQFSAHVADLIARASELATAPAEIPIALRLAVQDVAAAAGNALDALYAYQAVFGLEASGTGGPSPLQRAADANARAVAQGTRLFALAEASMLAPSIPWESYEQAVAARQALDDEIDALAASVSDKVYAALMALRAKLHRVIPPPDQDLPRLRSYTPASTLPALVIAYELYGDTEDELALVARNRIRHPGFVPGGQPLEILVDGSA
ncbi:MAG: hypothetical protein EYC70_00485 [Planctomycetota bacterium]|nr:MAG: hypothetical protein EYC70_00485 [Planctomycetota bacterium]